jgi:hypothetical protein
MNEEKAANTKLNRWRCAKASTRRLRPRRDTPRTSLQRPRRIDEPLPSCAVRTLRTERALRRTYHAATETISQVNDATMKAAAMLVSAVNEKTIAKASMPVAPSAAPAESTAAGIFPRRSPARPASRLRRISCFSIRVAVAQKMAGRARKRPPMNAP